MSQTSSVPWPRIHEFLEEVGSAEDDRAFARRVMEGVEKLIPFDVHCVFAVMDPGGALCPEKTVVESKKWFAHFRDRYWNIVPDLSGEKGVRTRTVDWNRYLDTEYATDFMKPQHIRHSLGVPALGPRAGGHVGILALNRSGQSPPFNDTEQHIMEILQPHLSNLYRILTRHPDRRPLTALRERYGVTGRELEVVELILSGLSNKMIGLRLGISERTVEAHCLHIFSKIGIKDRIALFVLARSLSTSPY